MSDIYKERSYARGDIGFGGKPGIVVVDFQTAFTDPDMPMGGAEFIERGVQNTSVYLKSRSAGAGCCCYVGYSNDRELPHWKGRRL